MANPQLQAFVIVYPQPAALYPAPIFQAFAIVIPAPDYPKLKGIEIFTTQPNLLPDYPKLKGMWLSLNQPTTISATATFNSTVNLK
ncbi:MAG: hypothetical protein WCW44_00435 [archaeon]|jgi:hypothetical protein